MNKPLLKTYILWRKHVGKPMANLEQFQYMFQPIKWILRQEMNIGLTYMLNSGNHKDTVDAANR